MTGGGIYDFDDGGAYIGECHDGSSHGLGLCTGPNRCGEYAGAWRFGFAVSGVYRWLNGNYYEGQWQEGRRHGLGVERMGNWTYKGEWTKGLKGRYGTRENRKTGSKYEGTWNIGKQDGYGVETYLDGGTYRGQWLRGMRHGLGVRESVSYGLAFRCLSSQPFPISTSPSTTVPSSIFSACPPNEDDNPEDPILRNRDQAIATCNTPAGDFVLRRQPLEEEDWPVKPRGRLILDKDGRPRGLRKAIANLRGLRRQRSSGDASDLEETDRRSTRGGSDTSRCSSPGSEEIGRRNYARKLDFDDRDPGEMEELVERYIGEWKEDERSGFGVCERSDGIKYEGEWLNNKKHGYGVTTFRNGTRVEGKYQKNVLVKRSGGDFHFQRDAKLLERVTASLLAAHKSSNAANEKAEIANDRTNTARNKAEVAECAASAAAAEAEMARSKSRDYDPKEPNKGVTIITNRLEAELTRPEVIDGNEHVMTHDNIIHSARSKFLSLIRTKKQQTDRKPKTTSGLESPLSLRQCRKDSLLGLGRQKSCPDDSVPLMTSGQRTSSRDYEPGMSTGSGKNNHDCALPVADFSYRPLSSAMATKFAVNRTPTNETEFNKSVPVKLLTRHQVELPVKLLARLPPGLPVEHPERHPVIRQVGHLVRHPVGFPDELPVKLPVGSNLIQIGVGRSRVDYSKAIPVSLTTSHHHGFCNKLVISGNDTEIRDRCSTDLINIGKKPTDSSTSGDAVRSSNKSPFQEVKGQGQVTEGMRKRDQSPTDVGCQKTDLMPLTIHALDSPTLLHRKSATGTGNMSDNISEATNIEKQSREVAYSINQEIKKELEKEEERQKNQTDWCIRRTRVLIVILAINYALGTIFNNDNDNDNYHHQQQQQQQNDWT